MGKNKKTPTVAESFTRSPYGRDRLMSATINRQDANTFANFLDRSKAIATYTLLCDGFTVAFEHTVSGGLELNVRVKP